MQFTGYAVQEFNSYKEEFSLLLLLFWWAVASGVTAIFATKVLAGALMYHTCTLAECVFTCIYILKWHSVCKKTHHIFIQTQSHKAYFQNRGSLCTLHNAASLSYHVCLVRGGRWRRLDNLIRSAELVPSTWFKQYRATLLCHWECFSTPDTYKLAHIFFISETWYHACKILLFLFLRYGSFYRNEIQPGNNYLTSPML